MFRYFVVRHSAHDSIASARAQPLAIHALERPRVVTVPESKVRNTHRRLCVKWRDDEARIAHWAHSSFVIRCTWYLDGEQTNRGLTIANEHGRMCEMEWQLSLFRTWWDATTRSGPLHHRDWHDRLGELACTWCDYYYSTTVDSPKYDSWIWSWLENECLNVIVADSRSIS